MGRLGRVIALAAAALGGGCSTSGPSRVIVLGLPGLDRRSVDLLMAEGKVPHFARLRQEGAYARLLTPPAVPDDVVLWTTMATGLPAEVHGFVAETVGATGEPGTPALVNRSTRRSRALWNLFSDAGRKVAVVGWPGTWPAEAVRGSFVSDRAWTGLRTPERQADDALAYPPELLGRLMPHLRSPEESAAAASVPTGPDLPRVATALAASESYGRMALELWRSEQPDLLVVALPAADPVSRRDGWPLDTKPASAREATETSALRQALDRTYVAADRLLGEQMAIMDRRTTLVVVSDRGFERAPEGVVYLFGHRVRRGGRIEGPTPLDIAPTILALAGLAAPRDMPGRVLTEGLDLRPETPRVASPQTASKAPTLDRGRAAADFNAGRFDEAVAAYARLVEKEPKDGALRASLAAALGGSKRFDEALRELDVAERLAPLDPQAYHNRGAVLEYLGRPKEAVEQYRTAVRYSPRYEPSRRALMRLTGSADPDPPRNDEERRARKLADEASAAAQDKEYARAMALLDQAERIAPRYALVQQYRSNVAYLMGDAGAAVRALEKALAIDPGNALYAANLDRLKRQPERR